MFSVTAMKHAEACRYCWMCRHICPVALATGKEVNTPRAKGLLVAMSKRGFPLDKDAAQIMYECCLCGACADECVTGFEPPVFIREARTQAVVDELVPSAVDQIIERIAQTGNIFARDEASKWASLADVVEAHARPAEVLFYVGDVAAWRAPGMARAYSTLLERAGVAHQILPWEPCGGGMVYDLLGDVSETRGACLTLADALDESGAKTVVALDPQDAVMLKQRYPQWGIPLKAQVRTATEFMRALASEGRLAFHATERTATYHDPAPLARDLDETECARELLARAGCTLREMFLNRRKTRACGSALFAEYAGNVALQMSKNRWADALRTGASILAVASPQDFALLAACAPEGLALADVFTLLCEATAQ